MILDPITTLSLLGGVSGAAGSMSWIAWRRAHKGRAASSVGRAGICDVIKSLIEGNTQVSLERERRLTRIETLKQLNGLSTGVSIVESAGDARLAVDSVVRAPEAHCWDMSCRSGTRCREA